MKKLTRDEMKKLSGGDAPAEWCVIQCWNGPHTCISATCMFHDSYSACVRGGEEIFTCSGTIGGDE